VLKTSRSNSFADGDLTIQRTPSNVQSSATLTLAAAGEAAVAGIVMQSVADNTGYTHQDDYCYYINDGVYGAFNNLMFDHATVRPRRLALSISPRDLTVPLSPTNSTKAAVPCDEDAIPADVDTQLFASTVFGPTCDSMDVISRSVLLPKMDIGDWMYFQNMGAYTCAAASGFNGFEPTTKFYVCSVMPEHFQLLAEEVRHSATSKK